MPLSGRGAQRCLVSITEGLSQTPGRAAPSSPGSWVWIKNMYASWDFPPYHFITEASNTRNSHTRTASVTRGACAACSAARLSASRESPDVWIHFEVADIGSWIPDAAACRSSVPPEELWPACDPVPCPIQTEAVPPARAPRHARPHRPHPGATPHAPPAPSHGTVCFTCQCGGVHGSR